MAAETSNFDLNALPDSEPCPFCVIASAYPYFDPNSPPNPSDDDVDPDKVSPASFIVLSTPTLLAFLDIMPLSPGHLLLCPRRHAQKLSDVSASEAAELGQYLRILSKALVKTTGVQDWNVVQNNGAAAAQVVNHVHYHLIPRPEIRASGRFSESFTMFGRGVRSELDDEEGVILAESLREGVRLVLEEEASKAKL
ncbi:HIT-like domain-containing protein [Pseudomassariella vexata]|uniref:HIT-like domain-containing protein n=1 Tax=Pseudomassariella vexata TaxID=1141098 RepID=A0A1Y2DFH8_9PEZI|nr:HIT-like domain-containing protein [Pseudomassariella vexata]ORY57445.1 HIT-like domain-containing protein [Pseudomassariella vexata]